MDLDALLQSHGDDAPSGEDLEYDPVFTDLEIAATHSAETEMGDVKQEAKEPEYKEVVRQKLISPHQLIRLLVYESLISIFCCCVSDTDITLKSLGV